MYFNDSNCLCFSASFIDFPCKKLEKSKIIKIDGWIVDIYCGVDSTKTCVKSVYL